MIKHANNMLLSWGPHCLVATQGVYKETSNSHQPVSCGPSDLVFGPVLSLQKVFLDKKKSYSDEEDVSVWNHYDVAKNRTLESDRTKFDF